VCCLSATTEYCHSRFSSISASQFKPAARSLPIASAQPFANIGALIRQSVCDHRLCRHYRRRADHGDGRHVSRWDFASDGDQDHLREPVGASPVVHPRRFRDSDVFVHVATNRGLRATPAAMRRQGLSRGNRLLHCDFGSERCVSLLQQGVGLLQELLTDRCLDVAGRIGMFARRLHVRTEHELHILKRMLVVSVRC
jgi:hypothetical protein